MGDCGPGFLGLLVILVPIMIVEQNLRFQVTRSRWQKRDDYYASGWITVEGSERNDNSLCLITFPGPGQYRLVVDVNGNRISSNVVVGSN